MEKDPVPANIRDAERWRRAGVKLLEHDPAMFQRLFVMLVTANTAESDEDEENITNGSILT